MLYRIQYLLFPGNDKKSVFFPNRLAETKRASIRGRRYRGKFGDNVLTYKLTNMFSKQACFGHRQSRPQPELVGFAGIMLLWHYKPEAYFAKEGTDTHRNGDCWKSWYYTSLSYPRIAVHNNDRANQLKINIDVTWFVICYRISKGTPNLNMNGNQSLTLFLIHHPNQRWNNSRWVINFY